MWWVLLYVKWLQCFFNARSLSMILFCPPPLITVKCHHIIASMTLKSAALSKRAETLRSISALFCCSGRRAFALVNFWFLFCCYWPLPERSGRVAHNSDFHPCSMSTPCPGMKLTLAWRLGAEISPNRSDKNLIPQAPMDWVVREQPWSLDVSKVLLSLCYDQRKTCRESEHSSPAHLPAHTLVWCIKIHEPHWFECQGLRQHSPSA